MILASCGSADSGAEGAETIDSTLVANGEPAINEKHFTATDLVDLDLSSYGIPVITKVPAGAQVLKYDVDGSISVFGGKFFKMNFKMMDGTVADNISMMLMMTTDAEMNPSFNAIEAQDDNGYLKSDKEGKLAFVHGVDVAGSSLIISDGMPYDISPDKFTDYTPEDIKLWYEAAKATDVKQ